MKALIASLALSLLLTVNIAKAEQIPDGCYVSFDNPGYCWSAYTGFYEWTAFANEFDTRYKYGNAMAAVIEDGKEYTNLYNICLADYGAMLASRNAISSQYDNLANAYNTNEGSRQEWIAYGNAQANLAAYNAELLKKEKARSKKLKKLCGSRCAKVK